MADPQQNDDSKSLTDVELERLKLYQDSFKHMTTFCSGAILLVSAVTGALFLPKPDYVLTLQGSIFLLSFGALFAMWGLAFVPGLIDGSTTPPSRWLWFLRPSSLRWLLWLSVGAAYNGFSLFSYFAAINLAQ